jgi:hypothetical protein
MEPKEMGRNYLVFPKTKRPPDGIVVIPRGRLQSFPKVQIRLALNGMAQWDAAGHQAP